MTETLVAIVTAHLLGDFILQNSWMVKNKARLWVLLLHVVLVTITTGLLLRSFHKDLLLCVALSHLFIDLVKQQAVKLRIAKLPNDRTQSDKSAEDQDTALLFFLDQTAHGIALLVIACLFPNAADGGWWPFFLPSSLQPCYPVALCFISGVILTVTVGGIAIGKLIAPIGAELKDRTKESTIVLDDQTPRTEDENGGADNYLVDGLRNGGKYIGWLERSLTLLLFLIGQPTGIGFLIAAKSILRFGDIKEEGHRKVAEYIIIGTFLSFGWALLVSVMTQQALEHFMPEEAVKEETLRVILE